MSAEREEQKVVNCGGTGCGWDVHCEPRRRMKTSARL